MDTTGRTTTTITASPNGAIERPTEWLELTPTRMRSTGPKDPQGHCIRTTLIYASGCSPCRSEVCSAQAEAEEPGQGSQGNWFKVGVL